MTAPTGAPPPASPDLAAQAADTVERYVALVRDNVTVKALRASRFIAFAPLLLILGLTIMVLVPIILVRVLSELPGGAWVAHTVIGALFTLLGAFMLSRAVRTPKETS